MSTRYKRQGHDADLLDGIETQTTNEVVNNETAEEATYRKRYGDLRRYAQEQTNAQNARIAELENQLKNSTSQALPKTEAEVDAWMKKFPDVAATVKTIAMKEVSKAREDVDTRFKRLDEREREDAKKNAQMQLHKMHPDFFTEIINTDDFKDWISSKSQVIQDALFVNETDVQAAADVISLYKNETGYRKPTKRDRNVDAEDVNLRSNGSPGDGSRGKSYRESDIAKTTSAQYEREEASIDEARRAGRIIYDVSGAE